MSLLIATLPDDDALRPRWLDEHVVSNAWGRVVNEFAALLPNREQPLDAILGPEKTAVLERGLAALSLQQRQALVQSPEAMLDLQELVLLEGGRYWSGLPRTPRLAEAAQRGQATIRQSETRKPARRTWAWMTTVALAAAVLLAFYIGGAFTPTPQQWGWAKPLPKAPDAKSYLLALADQADEWPNADLQDAKVLRQRLTELQAGCQRLIAAEHPPLSPTQQTWLKEKCRKWASDLDAQAAALDAGTPPATVKSNIDAIIQRLTTAIRTEAAKPG